LGEVPISLALRRSRRSRRACTSCIWASMVCSSVQEGIAMAMFCSSREGICAGACWQPYASSGEPLPPAPLATGDRHAVADAHESYPRSAHSTTLSTLSTLWVSGPFLYKTYKPINPLNPLIYRDLCDLWSLWSLWTLEVV